MMRKQVFAVTVTYVNLTAEVVVEEVIAVALWASGKRLVTILRLHDSNMKVVGPVWTPFNRMLGLGGFGGQYRT